MMAIFKPSLRTAYPPNMARQDIPPAGSSNSKIYLTTSLFCWAIFIDYNFCFRIFVDLSQKPPIKNIPYCREGAVQHQAVQQQTFYNLPINSISSSESSKLNTSRSICMCLVLLVPVSGMMPICLQKRKMIWAGIFWYF